MAAAYSRPAAVLLILLGCLAVPGVAEGKVFRGETAQGRAASVVVGSDSLVRRARVNWRARCRKGRFVDRTDFTRPFDSSTSDAIRDEGVYRIRQRGGWRARVTVRVAGRRSFDAAHPLLESWHGTLRARVIVTHRGRYVDTCRLRRLRWRVRLVP
jgi:hypothetical protein